MQHSRDPHLTALESKAERDDCEAQLELARLLDSLGEGVRGAYWLQRGAACGSVSAGALLGVWLLLGHNVEQDEVAGVAHLVDAATRNDDAACAFLATLHASGLAVPYEWRTALRWLIAAARLGNDRALTQLALLVDETAKDLQLRLLFAAAARGNAIASYFLGKALMETERPDARVAADLWLSVAAAAGNPCALRLAQPIGGPVQLLPVPDLDARFWSRVDDAIHLERLLATPRTSVQRDDPSIVTAAGVLPAAFCDYLIGLAAPLLRPAEVNDASGKARMHEMRTNSHARFGLTNTDVVSVLASRRIAQLIAEPFENQEDTMVLRYRPGETYDEHYDFIDPRVAAFQRELMVQGQRIATVLIYLNEEYAGGETDFPQLGWRYRGARGDALAFRNVTPAGLPEPRTLHAGRPPSSGEKWLLSKWLRDRRQLGRTFA